MDEFLHNCLIVGCQRVLGIKNAGIFIGLAYRRDTWNDDPAQVYLKLWQSKVRNLQGFIMTPAARLSAAIEILDAIMDLRQPAAQVVKEWGARNRYAGSKDRSAISSIVYDALRVRASAGWVMGAETARALVLGALALVRNMDCETIAALCTGEKYAPMQLSDGEREKLQAPTLDGAPANVRADIPEWLAPYFERAFGEELLTEGQAMARRAPVDLRVNLLKMSREKALAGLSHLDPQPTPLSPWGLRIATGEDGRGPALAAEPLFTKGQVELQDEGSQLSVLFAGVEPGWQVLDYCAGAGGKTLALASMMDNRGQIYATDSDGRRLMPIYKRLENSGVRTVQVRAPKGTRDILCRSGRALPSGVRRCAMHRFWHLAAKPGCKMAYPARRSGSADQGSGRSSHCSGSIRTAGRAARLRHMFGAVRGKRRPHGGDFWKATAGLPPSIPGALAAFLRRSGACRLCLTRMAQASACRQHAAERMVFTLRFCRGCPEPGCALPGCRRQ